MIKEMTKKIISLCFAVVFLLSLTCTPVRAEEKEYAENGATMIYSLSVSGNKWTAKTTCYELQDCKTSMFLYRKKGGELLYSDCVVGKKERRVGKTSVKFKRASLEKTNKKAKYGRSVHVLLVNGENAPLFNSKDLTKLK